MKFPDLVQPRFCKTPVSVALCGEGLSEDGSPEIIFEAELMCNYQDGAKTVLNDRQKKVEISGKALFCGDICPDVPEITGGTAEIFSVRRQIAGGKKHRNPDGTVNYTELDVI